MLEKIQKASSDLPMAASTLRRHLATFSEVLATSKRSAEAWITDAEKLPYPDGLAEEAQRREHLERPLSHLAHMDAIAATMAEEVRALERHHNETPTELGHAADGFDTVTEENLDLLQSLGFDRWDSMDDVHASWPTRNASPRSGWGSAFHPTSSRVGSLLASDPLAVRRASSSMRSTSGFPVIVLSPTTSGDTGLSGQTWRLGLTARSWGSIEN